VSILATKREGGETLGTSVKKEFLMKMQLNLMAGALAVVSVLAIHPAAKAQGIIDGSQHGAAVGNHDAGPVGAVVGGVVGGAIGGVEGAVGVPHHRYYYSRHAYYYHHNHYYR
jgi:hypothetical protein